MSPCLDQHQLVPARQFVASIRPYRAVLDREMPQIQVTPAPLAGAEVPSTSGRRPAGSRRRVRSFSASPRPGSPPSSAVTSSSVTIQRRIRRPASPQAEKVCVRAFSEPVISRRVSWWCAGRPGWPAGRRVVTGSDAGQDLRLTCVDGIVSRDKNAAESEHPCPEQQVDPGNSVFNGSDRMNRRARDGIARRAQFGDWQ
jgi:hypothetical protein